jgi:peptidoglycan/xylan/chitin deacetylase (PgdA/CDA1 family)
MLSSISRVTTLENALDRLDVADPGPQAVVLSFDDGTRDFLSKALPILDEFGLPATLYVSPLKIGSPGFLDWSELKEISDRNVAVESHGLDHRSLKGLSVSELLKQVEQSKKMLEDKLGKRVTSIAYPYGTLRDFDESVKQGVREAGYRSACSSLNGLNRAGADRYELRRTKIEQHDQPVFAWIVAGHLDSWAFIDTHFANIQNSYF